MLQRWMVGTGLAMAVAAAACAGPYGNMSEIASSSVPGDSFRTVVVISGDDDQSALQITAKVRAQLNDAGVTALKRSGMWSMEREALTDVCPLGQPHDVDGLLFVSWNQLDLYDCRTHKPAYQIKGAMRGTDAMVKRLLGYLRVLPAS